MKAAASCLIFFAAGAVTQAQVSLYYDRASYLGDSRLSAATLSSVNFDDLTPGTDLNGSAFAGATFTPNGSTPLEVMAGSTGIRYTLSPSTGANVLSPGGSNPGLETDGLTVTFDVPVQAAGMDVVFDVPDGASYVGVSFYDASNTLLGSNGFIPCPGGAPGYQFVGLVADSAVIKSIVFNEYDDSAADDNVAYDSLVFTAIPEPATTAAVMGLAFAGVFAASRHAKRRTHNTERG